MRLFIAINFTEEIEECLLDTIRKLKSISQAGNFSRPENLHLTLVFIGETNRITDIQKAMDTISAKSFDLAVGGLGKFRRQYGNIYWVGVDKNQALTELYQYLKQILTNLDFFTEDREYRPHITLGREVILTKRPEIIIPSMSMPVSKISLMKSERMGGKLIYTEIYRKNLE